MEGTVATVTALRILPIALGIVTCLFAQSEQQFAELRDLRLQDGSTLASCRIGYRTFGNLNASRSNAVLFPTWFSGKSAALEASIGPGRMVDSSRFFVIAVDALGNGVSCSPSNGPKPFPMITIADMVESQYRLLIEHLKITKLHAVIGISMGGMQSFEWAVAKPGFADRIVPIIGSPKLSSVDLLLWQAQLSVIENAQSAGGDLRQAMKGVQAIHQFALYTPEYRRQKTAPSEFAAFKESFEKSAVEGMDPLDWAVQLRAMMSQDVYRNFQGSPERAGAAVKSKVLVVVANQDMMVNPQAAREFARVAGFDLLELNSNCGHMATSCESGRVTEAVKAFLEN
jgi:homoserine O-acetyltransferase